MASQAARAAYGGGPSTYPKPKILRIGIVQGGRIVEERLVRTARQHHHRAVGEEHVRRPLRGAAPAVGAVHGHARVGYVAHFADAMDARIAVGNEVISLAQLKQSQKIRKQGPAWVMLLDERSRGKITFGDVTVLFQFVTPPPPQPRPQLPASVRGSIASNLDWFFTTIAVTSFVAHLAMVIYLRSVDWPREVDVEAIPDRFVQMVVKKPEPPPQPVAEEKVEEKKEEAAEKEDEEEARPRQARADRGRAGGGRSREAAAGRRAAGPPGRGGQEHRHPQAPGRQGGRRGLDRRRARQGRRRPRPGEGFPGRGRPHGGHRRRRLCAGSRPAPAARARWPASPACAAAARSPAAAPAPSARSGRSRQSSRSEAPAVDGDLDPGIISAEVRKRMGAIKGCYERALKRNPT